MKNIHLYMKKEHYNCMGSDETLFAQTFGNYPIVRVLDHLITGEDFDYSISDISEGADVSWSSMHEIIPALEKKGLIKKTREIGRAKMYCINKSNEIAKLLIKMHRKLILADIDKRIAENRKLKVRA